MAGIILSEADVARFRTKTRRNRAKGCLLWTASVRPDGYGQFRVGRATLAAHRVAYLIAYGPIPAGALVCHRCDNKLCVEARGHLFLGSQGANMADCVAKGRIATGQRHGTRTCPDRVARGERKGTAKLTADAVVEIRLLCEEGESRLAIARRYGISRSLVGLLAARKRWAHVKLP